MKKEASLSGHNKRNQDLPNEILDLLDLLVEIALDQIVADDAEKQQHETGETP